MSTIIQPGDTIELDSRDWTLFQFSWDKHLPEGVELNDQGEINITAATVPPEEPVTLEIDSLAMLTGNRKVQFRLKGGAKGQSYRVAHFVAPNTSPEQKRERSFYVFVKDL
jgi:hypothetical protein